MIGIGSMVGSGLKIGASIFGGIAASKAIKQQKQNVERQMKENQNWYDQRYNEDATQRADAQRLLTMTAENIRNQNRQAAGSQAVMGGTTEGVAAAKAASNDALANTMSNINAAADMRKDKIENLYMSTKGALNDKLNDLAQKRADNIASAVNTAAGAASDMVGKF